MSGKIFYRQRTKVKEGAGTPRYRVVAVADVNLKVYGNHLREKELGQIAKECNAKLIELKSRRRNKKDKTTRKSSK